MITIAVLGANGQVGTEVCLLLNHWTNVNVVAICRNELSSAFLRKLGITCRHGDVTNPGSARELLRDCDVVADFVLPVGSFNEITESYRRIYSSVFSALPEKCSYVLASSQMAVGHGGNDKNIKSRFFPRTVYGATKRSSEALARHFAHKRAIPLYIFRLAQVHGLLQSVSASYKALIRNGYGIQIPKSSSYTVFCYSIAEAIVNIGRGLEQQGTFLVESTPAWTWRELVDFLTDGKAFVRETNITRLTVRNRLESWVRSVALSMQEPLQANILRYFPEYELTLKIRNRRSVLRATIDTLAMPPMRVLEVTPGRVPGRRLNSLSDSRTSMRGLWDECQRKIDVLGRLN